MNKHRHPELYMRKPYNKNYFEGWYYKQVDKHMENTISFIPSVSFSKGKGKAYLQIIYQKNKELFTDLIEYDISHFFSTKQTFSVILEKNFFSLNKIRLDFEGKTLKVQGDLKFSGITKLEESNLQPNIMGFFSYLPFMQCKHGVLSMYHKLTGSLVINGEEINFDGGRGYIEKDWGWSFPKEYMWIQCMHFNKPETSLFFSVAHIPMMAFSFQGFICNLLFHGKQYRFATYNGSKLKYQKKDGWSMIRLENKDYTLYILAKSSINKDLLAPRNGKMDIQIKEALKGDVKIKLKRNKDSKIIYKDESNQGSMEIVGY